MLRRAGYERSFETLAAADRQEARLSYCASKVTGSEFFIPREIARLRFAPLGMTTSNKGDGVLRRLNDDGFAVFAEGTAEGIGNFAHGGVGLDGGEDDGHEVLGAASAAFDFVECGF